MQYLKLNNGVSMPVIGIGGWSQKKENIIDALNVGYRMIDTAAQYGNESEVGGAIRDFGVGRGDIFLTTKLWTQDIREHRVKEAFEESLNRLGTDYVDLYLIHWPAEGFENAYLEMEKLYKEGKVRAIGVSNFEKHHLDALVQNGASVVPVVNQVEIHPYFSNSEIVDECNKRGTVPEAWCPLGGPGSSEMNDEKIQGVAEKYDKTIAQIILRWHIQRGVAVIPKSSNPERMKQNFDVFDFELDSRDMDIINELDCGKRLGAHPDNFDF
ncbi:aldo/keto reductase [Butyrivibrio sp. WCD3002]|uniref:aldo/keto reductase n=1 Tax=Butyrivibrio sp. WCD3002 TaxID=1280676 RepID=UPI000415F060|nr:aldo/keto reductase [Butyrivibrio sp. WCD3002]